MTKTQRTLTAWTLCLGSVLVAGCNRSPGADPSPQSDPSTQPRRKGPIGVYQGLQGHAAPLNQFAHDRGGPASETEALSLRRARSATAASRALLAPGPSAAAVAPGTSTLVLYDDDGPYGHLGELYAIAAGQLASHFGTWVAKPVGQYAAGDANSVKVVIYIGSTYRDASPTSPPPLPAVFLSDVLATTTPVVWIYDNIWQLANSSSTFTATYGFQPWVFSAPTFDKVAYKGRTLARYAASGATGLLQLNPFDATKAKVLATATSVDGLTSIPWAIRSKNLTYVTENPFAYIRENDRYLVFSDLLFDALAPATPERHRALVRIEDVSPVEDPANLRAIADLLFRAGAPFSVALVPRYEDPTGVYNCLPAPGGVCRPTPESYGISDDPAFVNAIQYMVSRGGTLVLHGFKHQFSDVSNPYLIQTAPFPPDPVGNCPGRTVDGKQVCDPYSGVTADDFEFWMSHVNAANYVILDGPVPGDSAAYASGRIDGAFLELSLAGLSPSLLFGFEFPHYAGSAVDSRTIAQRFGQLRPGVPNAYHRALYFKGALTGAPDDATRYIGQFFPYAVNDVYGWRVIPENIGNYEPVPVNNNPPRLPADLVANATANLVVRDGVASFFYHPYYGTPVLQQIVDGVKGAGYTFVAPSSL